MTNALDEWWMVSEFSEIYLFFSRKGIKLNSEWELSLLSSSIFSHD